MSVEEKAATLNSHPLWIQQNINFEQSCLRGGGGGGGSIENIQRIDPICGFVFWEFDLPIKQVIFL